MQRQVVLQPCADAEAQSNYQHTIRQFVMARDIEPFLTPAERDAVIRLYPDGRLRVWGVKDGKDGKIRESWEKIRSGDIAFFAWKSVLHSKASIMLTFQSDALAEFLWNDKAFHNVYLLEDLQSVDISYEMFNRAAGYKEKNILRGFRVLDEKRSKLVLDFFSYDSEAETSVEEISREDCSEAIQNLWKQETLDKTAKRTERKEQALLRRLLFGKKREETCALCGKKYPVEFLTAAHIKRRADCTMEERKDVPSIVMPACRFGCDELYERGYLLVFDGEIVLNDQKWIPDTVREYAGPIAGRRCSCWSDATKGYFDAHNKKFGR